MELGFSVAAGPLSQISVSLFSVELAVQLATGAYGWWKVRDRGRSLSGLVDSKGAQISTTSTFNLLRYVDRRKDCLLRGVARDPDGVLSCVNLPNASTASAGDAGMICLRAVVCALLCFYNIPTVLEILAAALPGTLYTSDQEGGNEVIEGPLLASLREYIKAAAAEEDSDDLRQRLQDIVDTKLSNITGATKKDVFECDQFLESDAPNFIGVLRWILTPVIKREQRVYPTRSLKVWTFALIMAQLGFEVFAAMHTISSKEDYEIFVEKVGYQSTYQEVFLVTSNSVPTDPLAVGGQKPSTLSKPRIGSIRSIPRIAFRHLKDSKSRANTEFLSEVWEFTFKYVLGLIERPPQVEFYNGFDVEILFTKAALSGFGEKRSYLPSNKRLSDKLQWLTLVIFKPLQIYLPSSSDTDSVWTRTNTVGQFQGLSTDYLDLPQDDDADDWYITRTVVLATIYALCCNWLYRDNSTAAVDLLDTEVAFCPDFIRRGNLATWTSFSCFNCRVFSDRTPSSFNPNWRFAASMVHNKWLHLLYLVFSGTPNDPDVHRKLPEVSDATSSKLSKTILGFQKNGMVFFPEFLINPSASPEDWFTYHLRVGQVLDLPLDDDGFISHANTPVHTNTSNTDIWEYGPTGTITTLVENQPSDAIIRLDAEPWWEFDQKTVVFRVRVDGIVKAIFGPEAIYKKYRRKQESKCGCPTPNVVSIELGKSVVVLRVSDFLRNYNKKMVYDKTKPYEKPSVFVQTGGDPTSQMVCLAISPYNSSHMAIGCLDSLNEQSLSEFHVL